MTGNSLFFFEGAVKLKYLACLLCLLVILAAVDSVPDPPATSPLTNVNCAITAFHLHGPCTAPESQRFTASWLLRDIPVHWFSFRLDFSNEPGGFYARPRIHHAADPSPPACS